MKDSHKNMISFGWKAGTEQFLPQELVVAAKAADEAGFDFLDASDHFQPWSEAGQASFSWTLLGAIAANTERIRLGTCVSCPILRYHPSILAQAVATLACLAQDRVYLGVGTGEALNEYAATAQWPSFSVRQRMLAESLVLMRSLWIGDNVTFRGAYYETRSATLFTKPETIVPVYISSRVPDSAYFAGFHGDGLVSVGGESDETYRQIIENFNAGAADTGKDPKQVPKIIELGVDYTNDTRKALAYREKYWAGTFVPALFDQKIYTPKMSEKNGAVVGDAIIKQRTCISDNPIDHVKFVMRYIQLGFNHIVLHSALPDQAGFVRAYGKEVLPKLRAIKQ